MFDRTKWGSPVSKAKDHIEACDRLLFFLWDLTTGQGVTGRECTRAARRFAKFLIREIERQEKLTSSGSTALARRGLIIPHSLISAWAWNILEDCCNRRAPVPWELCQVLYHQLGCSHLTTRRRPISAARRTAEALLRDNPNITVREVARRARANPGSVHRWKRAIDRDYEREAYLRMKKLTGAGRFFAGARSALIKARAKPLPK